ncbi:MAG TPA: phosphohistidine phosphatase SixA [Candidatus Binatia bacterium]
MNLYLMRHGIAVAKDDPEIHSDEERALTKKGAKRVRKAAKGLSKLDVAFDRILTSPLPRARQTAEIVAKVFKMKGEIEELPQLAPATPAEELVAGLAGYRELENVLLVGHEPLLGEAASVLLARERRVRLSLKKGGVCFVEADGLAPENPAVLGWMMTPKQLRLLAKS